MKNISFVKMSGAGSDFIIETFAKPLKGGHSIAKMLEYNKCCRLNIGFLVKRGLAKHPIK